MMMSIFLGHITRDDCEDLLSCSVERVAKNGFAVFAYFTNLREDHEEI